MSSTLPNCSCVTSHASCTYLLSTHSYRALLNHLRSASARHYPILKEIDSYDGKGSILSFAFDLNSIQSLHASSTLSFTLSRYTWVLHLCTRKNFIPKFTELQLTGCMYVISSVSNSTFCKTLSTSAATFRIVVSDTSMLVLNPCRNRRSCADLARRAIESEVGES